MSYDWGYLLWLLGIAILFIGDFKEYYKNYNDKDWLIKLPLPIIIVVISARVLCYYFFGHNSRYQIDRRRNQIFLESCKLASEKIYQINDMNVAGIFFNDCGVDKIYYDGIENGHYSSRQTENVADAKIKLLEKGLIEFYETPKNVTV